MDRWFFDFDCEWLGLIRQQAWYPFTFLRFEVQYDPSCGNVSWTLGFLGFVFLGGYTYNLTPPALIAALEAYEEIRKKMKKENSPHE